MPNRSRVKRTPLERAFARDMGAVAIKAGAMTYGGLVKAYRQLGREYVAKARRDRFATREIKRRIAEQILYAAWERDCPLATLRRKFRELSRFGYADVERKAQFHLLFARHLYLSGHGRQAIRMLAPVATELERHLRRKPSRLGRDLLKLATELLKQGDARAPHRSPAQQEQAR